MTIYFSYNNIDFKITNQVITEIYNNRQVKQSDYETGGMLIGSIIKGTNAMIIEDVTLPIESDKRSRFNFFRSSKHNKLLHDKWRSSGFTKMYFGDWHTHPQDIPTPSSQDYSNWRTILIKAKTDATKLLFLIAGKMSYCIWLGERNSHELIKVFEANYNE